MVSIYASKLYRSSTRKSKIQAAMNDPINTELIKQLEEYLDDEYKPDVHVNDSEPDNIKIDHETKEETTPSHLDNFTESHHQPITPGVSGNSDANPDTEDTTNIDGTQDNDDTKDNDDTHSDDTVANSSTTIDKKKSTVVADTVISKPFVENQVSLNGLAGEVKGTLNARVNTSGVSRVSVKNNEIWVYYNDDTNLNNIMSTVIDVLSASGYYYLIFNRLARTDNAIVFTIDGNDTSNEMRSISNE